MKITRRKLRQMLLREMAVRRILEIEMSDQIYLIHPDLPGGRVFAGDTVEDLVNALYEMLDQGFTHIVMSQDLRDFRKDRSVFLYGVYTVIPQAIKALKVRKDPRVLFRPRS